MKDGTRLALDILISAAFALVAAAVGFLVGALLSFIVLRLFPGSESLGSFLIAVFAVLFPFLCSIMAGFLAFPLCGIWLDQRRQALRPSPLPPQS